MPYKEISGIYKITNLVNKKTYIGSAKSILNRFSVHKRTLRRNKHFNKHLQSSYNKYGIDNFSFEILEIIDCKNVNFINEREEFFIQKYKSNDNKFGYNNRVICTTNFGRKFSKEHIENLKNSHLGIKHTKESIEKIRVAGYKEVYKIDSNKNILSKYKSIIEAAEINNVHRQSISMCCRGVLNSSGGFFWCFIEDFDKKNFKKIKKSSKQIKWTYKNLETGEEYSKLSNVADLLNINITKLQHMLSGKNINKTKFIRYLSI